MNSEKISNWIKEKVNQAGAKGIVVGLSGGIDSSVIAALSKKAVGNNVLGVIMPCRSNPTDVEHAKMLAKKFGIKMQVVDLSPIFDMLMKTLPPGNEIARANLKPRLRMLTLYYFANTNSCLVAGTGNKSEEMVGYFTKYGDGGVDILPIGDLLKKDVRVLAAELRVPKEIIDKSPSAGLWEGQTDEKEMGITYEQLDSILQNNNFNGELGRKVSEMIRKSEHKRRPPEVCKL